MSDPFDMAKGSLVLIGDLNWRRNSIKHALAAYLFGYREQFEHLGMRCTIAWWRGQPYLISLREVAP